MHMIAPYRGEDSPDLDLSSFVIPHGTQSDQDEEVWDFYG